MLISTIGVIHTCDFFPVQTFPATLDVRLKSPGTTGETLLDTLLSCGVAINSQDGEGQTCAWGAIDRCEHLEILLQKGADPLLRDKNGETSLTYAATQSRGLEVPAKVESVKTILGWIDLNWTKVSHNEIHQEVSSKAETGTVAKKNWKTVRLLQRFWRVHFEGM
ncbi:ankyrin [Penicillium hispanicum]|uniref:ankyrin n=1 Tax=Penicillium hispanicum TaxID=1080232 RepID=UPI00254015B2|nr:ankyrin [Penicillium hispanicum]KAJ5585504.1 ankyrin [Penicillium hispanicum]